MDSGLYPIVLSISALLALAVAATVYAAVKAAINSTKGLRYTHSIAILGYPRSGKTTLIVTILHRILSSKIAKSIRVTGRETIEKISEYNEMIVSGQNLGATTDSDVFIYRLQYIRGEPSPLYRLVGRPSRIYDVAVADFPGEYSEDLAEGKRPRRRRKVAEQPDGAEFAPAGPSQVGRLYDPEYHSWISQADKYVVLIDIADVVKVKLDASVLKARIFSAVFYLKESSLEDSKSLHHKPAALVFTKSDLLSSRTFNFDGIDTYNYRQVNGIDFDPDVFHKNSEAMLRIFSETIVMMKNNFSRVEVIFHSSYMNDGVFPENATRLIDFMVP